MAKIVTYNFLVDGLHPHSCDYIFRYYTTNFGLVLYHLIALPEFEVKPKTNRTSFSTSSQQSAAAAAHDKKSTGVPLGSTAVRVHVDPQIYSCRSYSPGPDPVANVFLSYALRGPLSA